MNNKYAFVFPGQGSQTVGMLAELAEYYPIVKDTFLEASAVLGYSLWQLAQTGPEAQLNQTVYTQPALLAAGVAIWRVWCSLDGCKPILMAGHSLGEYTALVCAEAISFKDGIRLVAERGRLMQEAVPEDVGAMAAIIGLDDDTVMTVCQKAAQGAVVMPANYNANGQVVIAGHKDAVERAIETAKQSGAKLAKLIPVSVPSHCSLMQEAATQFTKTLADIAIKPPKIAVVNNVAVKTNQHPDEIRTALLQQLANPVQWVKTIQYFAAEGIQTIIECGPGKVLSGLNKRIVADIPTLAINNPASIEGALALV